MSVSVIMAAYNAEASIERALTSALRQTEPVHEIIVVDDVSTDQTRAVVQSIAKSDSRVRLIQSAENKGPSGSRNVAIRAAQADFIAVLDADDAWAPNRVEVMLRAAAEHDADVVTDNQLLYDAGADQVTRTGFSTERGLRTIRPIDAFEQEIKLGAEFSYGILKPVIRRAFLNAHQISYREDTRYGEDMLLLAELLLSGARAVLIPDPLYIYTTRVGDVSGASSPHSRSDPRFDLFADGVETLRFKYRAAITADLDGAMTRIIRRFRFEHQANVARAKRRDRGLLAYALHVAVRPRILTEAIGARLRKLDSSAP